MVRRPTEPSPMGASGSLPTEPHGAQSSHIDGASSLLDRRPSSPQSSFRCTPDVSDPDPDVPIPSIERDHSDAGSSVSRDTPNAHIRTPSISLSPPPSSGVETPASSPTPVPGASRTGSTMQSLDGEMERLRLSQEYSDNEPFSSIPRPFQAAQARSSEQLVSATDQRESGQTTETDDVVDNMAQMRLDSGATRSNSTDESRLSPLPSDPSRNNGEASRGRRLSSRSSRRRSSSQLRHQVKDEEPPQELFHEPDFRRAITDTESLVARLIVALASSPLHSQAGSRIGQLHEEANGLKCFKSPGTRTVGLVGGSGVGKSSLINSLLDTEGLARTSGGGGACTCVVTEYHFHEHDNEGFDAEFSIETEYFTMDELQEQFTELLNSYRKYHLRPSEDNGETYSGSDLTELRNNAKVATDTFEAAFPNQLLHNEGFLLNGSEETVVRTLLTWTGNGLPLMRQGSSNQQRENFTSAKSCSDRLAELASVPPPPEQGVAHMACVWPFIRKIRVYLRAYILSKDLVLVDLPGLRDINSARLKITERYIRECDEIFAVFDIGRSTSDTVSEDVFTLARARGAPDMKIGIICTMSDRNLKPGEARRDWGTRIGKTIDDMHRIVIERRDCVKRKDAELRDFVEDGPIPEDDREVYLDLQRSLFEEQRRLSEDEFQLKSYLMKTRNQKVEETLRRRYQSQVPGGNLQIFCVSNSDYWKLRNEPKQTAMPLLHLSGIIEVRRHCLSIVAESQLRAASQYMADSVPALLGSIDVWVQSGSGDVSVEQKRLIVNVMNEVEGVLGALTRPAGPISTGGRAMEIRFEEDVSRVMRPIPAAWSESALEAAKSWEEGAWQTYAAFCRQYGYHATEKTGWIYRCWNTEAMVAMVTQMTPRWQAFDQNLADFLLLWSRDVNAKFQEAITLADPTGFPNGSLGALSTTLRHRQALLQNAIERLWDDFQGDLRQLRTDALSGIRTSIIGQLMEAYYSRCNRDSGKGVWERRKIIIRGRFGDIRLFESLRREIVDKFHSLAYQLADKVQEAVRTHLAVVQNDLDAGRNANVVLESENHPQLLRRLEEELPRFRDEMGRINQSIARYR